MKSSSGMVTGLSLLIAALGTSMAVSQENSGDGLGHAV